VLVIGVFLIFLLAVLGGCRQADSVVLVNVAGPGDLGATSLRASLANAGSEASFDFAPAAGIVLPASFSVRLPRSRTGDVAVVVAALGPGGELLAHGSASTGLVAGAIVELDVWLDVLPGSTEDGGGGAGDGDWLGGRREDAGSGEDVVDE
jgi:hypothetical protein